MKKIQLNQIEHNYKVSQDTPELEPNIKEDCLFIDNDEVVGFYIKDMSKYSHAANHLADIADKELRSDKVPKSILRRASDVKASREGETGVTQYSVIIGSVPPKTFMRRPYRSRSSVHNVPSAKVFIKSMYLLAKESEKIIKKVAPEIYNNLCDMSKNIEDKWKFANFFTSSISNYNISAPYHIDKFNLPKSLNVIITKRAKSTGGNLHIPDYNAVIDQCDHSMIVYPAWRNVHGVTPIKTETKDGYRNTLIFYALRDFMLKDSDEESR